MFVLIIAIKKKFCKHDWVINHSEDGPYTTVFCPGFQKGRVQSEKGTFSVVNCHRELVISAVN